jgi:hypothetical protein
MTRKKKMWRRRKMMTRIESWHEIVPVIKATQHALIDIW